MIPLKRPPEPPILTQKKDEWSAKYQELRQQKTNARPHPSQYAHPVIKNALRAMSFHKCFYCERKLSESEDQVEHYLEVAEHPHLAFEWENLFLSCAECNKHKRPNSEIPVEECLNPCNEKHRVEDHLIFEQEIIRAYNYSERGLRTIQKYGLDRGDLDLQRLRRLQYFYKVLLTIQRRQIADGGRAINEQERELLLSFQQSDQPFSRMFQCYFTKNTL